MPKRDVLHLLQQTVGTTKHASQTQVAMHFHVLRISEIVGGNFDRTVSLDFRSGVDAEDWTELAKRDHLKPIDVANLTSTHYLTKVSGSP